HVHGWRWKNQPHLDRWEHAIDTRTVPAIEIEQLSSDRRIGEYAMLRLRLEQGIDYSDFSARWDCDARDIFCVPIDRYARQGLITGDGGGVRLTDAGVAVADALAAEFLTAACAASRR